MVIPELIRFIWERGIEFDEEVEIGSSRQLYKPAQSYQKR